jgi:SAM-dependent methyltransferase
MMATAAAIWHDVECGAYEADLPLWEELAERGGPVLELGCGTGRVALRLARAGHRVIGLDHDHDLVLELAQRASGLPLDPRCADALDFELEEPVSLVLAPMQFLQLLPGSDSRLRCLRRVAASLRPGGVLAAAIVEGAPAAPADALPPLPDVRELDDGWIYSSLPTAVATLAAGEIALRRLRQTISPEGSLSEETNEIRIRLLDAAELEGEAKAAGFASAGCRVIHETEAHVGSTVVLLERVS